MTEMERGDRSLAERDYRFGAQSPKTGVPVRRACKATAQYK